MPVAASRAVVVGAFLLLAPPAQAQEPGKVDLEAAEALIELLGAPVYTGDGLAIGRIADIAFDDEGQPTRLRVKTEVMLGIGTRTIEITKGGFIVLRGAAVLDLPAEALASIPEVADEE